TRPPKTPTMAARMQHPGAGEPRSEPGLAEADSMGSDMDGNSGPTRRETQRAIWLRATGVDRTPPARYTKGRPHETHPRHPRPPDRRLLRHLADERPPHRPEELPLRLQPGEPV